VIIYRWEKSVAGCYREFSGDDSRHGGQIWWHWPCPGWWAEGPLSMYQSLQQVSTASSVCTQNFCKIIRPSIWKCKYWCCCFILSTYLLSGIVAQTCMSVLRCTDPSENCSFCPCKVRVHCLNHWLMTRTHSFPRVAEFQAELRNLPFSAQFRYFHGISQNFAKIEKWPMISTIVSFTT